MNIRSLIPAVFAACTLTLAATSSVQAQGLGISAGGNYNRFNDIDLGDASVTFNNAVGYHVGIFLELGGGPLSLRPGVYYHTMGRYEFPGGEELDVAALEVPLDVRLTLASLGGIQPYLLGGPVLTLPQTDQFGDALTDLSLTGDVGFGVALGLPGSGFRLLPEVRYSIGVTGFLSEEFQVAGLTITPSDADRRFTRIMLRLNVMF